MLSRRASKIFFGTLVLLLIVSVVFCYGRLIAQTTSTKAQPQQDSGQKLDEVLKNQKKVLEKLDNIQREIKARCK